MTPIITLIGQKHTGKSTLYNQLINNFKNKTKNYQLSTRDYKVSQIKILNILIKIVDTAGFKSKPNILEKNL
ncbi:hypothetical protein HIC20_00710 [Buchnera aphidicola (Hormaphis cornu)]|nr:hypothetical protein HIC20_00710 [Buchnera aphidicola (Hormaphis cornu)]